MDEERRSGRSVISRLLGPLRITSKWQPLALLALQLACACLILLLHEDELARLEDKNLTTSIDASETYAHWRFEEAITAYSRPGSSRAKAEADWLIARVSLEKAELQARELAAVHDRVVGNVLTDVTASEARLHVRLIDLTSDFAGRARHRRELAMSGVNADMWSINSTLDEEFDAVQEDIRRTCGQIIDAIDGRIAAARSPQRVLFVAIFLIQLLLVAVPALDALARHMEQSQRRRALARRRTRPPLTVDEQRERRVLVERLAEHEGDWHQLAMEEGIPAARMWTRLRYLRIVKGS